MHFIPYFIGLFFGGGLLSDGFTFIVGVLLILVVSVIKSVYSVNLRLSLKLLYVASGLLLLSVVPIYTFLYLQEVRGLFPGNNGLGYGLFYFFGSWAAKGLIGLSVLLVVIQFFKSPPKDTNTHQL